MNILLHPLFASLLSLCVPAASSGLPAGLLASGPAPDEQHSAPATLGQAEPPLRDTSAPAETEADADASAAAPEQAAPEASEPEGPDPQAVEVDDPPERAAEGEPPPDPAKDYSHHNLGSFAVSAGWGFQMVLPYEDGQFCGEFSTDPDALSGSSGGRKALCTGGAPWYMDFTGGFGVLPRLDVVLTFRLNLTKRDWSCDDGDDPESCKGLFVDKLGFGLIPGIRAWISKPTEMFKLGAAVEFLWMHENFSGYRNRPTCSGMQGAEVICPLGTEGAVVEAEQDTGDDDVGLRLGPVLQLDPHHNVGIFLIPAVRMAFLRWFEAGFEAQLGVQARFP